MANLDGWRLGDELAGGLLFRLGRPRTAIKSDPTAGAGSCSGVPNSLTDRVVVDHRFTCPVDADRTKQAMLNRIPLGRAGRIVSHRNTQPCLVRNLLEPVLPVMRPGPIGASRIREDQEFLRRRVQGTTNATPPRVDGVGSKGRRIVGRSHDDEAIATCHIVDAVGNRYTIGITRKVVHVDVDRCLAPLATLILEQTHQLSLLRIDADDRLSSLCERVFQLVDVRELLVPIRRRPPRQPLSTESKSILRSAKHLPSLGVADPEYARECARRLPCPFHRRRRISRGRPLHHVSHAPRQVGPFFSSGFRPPPGRRTRSAGTGSSPTSSRWPCAMVVRLIPVTRDSSATPPCPSRSASNPTTRLACFSSRSAITRFTFRCSIASALRGCSRHASHSQAWMVSSAMAPLDHAGITRSSAQVIRVQPLSPASKPLARLPQDSRHRLLAETNAIGPSGNRRLPISTSLALIRSCTSRRSSKRQIILLLLLQHKGNLSLHTPANTAIEDPSSAFWIVGCRDPRGTLMSELIKHCRRYRQPRISHFNEPPSTGEVTVWNVQESDRPTLRQRSCNISLSTSGGPLST